MITVQYREEKCRAMSQVFSWVRVQLVLNMWAFLCLCAVAFRIAANDHNRVDMGACVTTDLSGVCGCTSLTVS